MQFLPDSMLMDASHVYKNVSETEFVFLVIREESILYEKNFIKIKHRFHAFFQCFEKIRGFELVFLI